MHAAEEVLVAAARAKEEERQRKERDLQERRGAQEAEKQRKA